MSINQRFIELHYDADKLKFADAAAEQEFYRALGYAVMWGSTPGQLAQDTAEFAAVSIEKDGEIAVGHYPKVDMDTSTIDTLIKVGKVANALGKLRDELITPGARPFHMVGILREGAQKYEFHS